MPCGKNEPFCSIRLTIGQGRLCHVFQLQEFHLGRRCMTELTQKVADDRKITI